MAGKIPDSRSVLQNAPLAAEEDAVLDAYRRWGYFEAALDPLGVLTPIRHPELRLGSESAARARRLYCGTIGAEFMHMPAAENRYWVAVRLEQDAPEPDRTRILKRLVQSD